jgi:hypothetical protein
MMIRTLSLVAVLLAACLSASCVANRAYRLQQSVYSEQLRTEEFDRTNTSALGQSWPYRMAFVEFDDQGELFHRPQLDAALGEIARTKAAARAAGVNPVVVLFVHGWKNNASESSGNVWGFRQILAGLSMRYAQAPVIGIYIGWRGAVISAPIIKEFTFFDRQQKSQNLPSAHLVETLLKVMQAAKGPAFDDASTISILIGHSFGGAVLETALTQTLMGMVVNAGPQQQMRWPATLIMFLNEAQDATRSHQLLEALHANLPPRPACLPPGSPQEADRPVLLSISSTGDYATRAAFPGARAIVRPFHSLRTYPEPDFLDIGGQKPMFFQTTAHMANFQSHIMGRADDERIGEALAACKPNVDVTLDDVRYVIVEKPGSLNRTPYWAMHMPASVVPDHSTIFTPIFRNFLTSLVTQATPAR